MHRIAIIASSKDPAGINIRGNLMELFDFDKTNETFDNNPIFRHSKIKNKNIKLYLINDDLIFSENLDKKIDADDFIFIKVVALEKLKEDRLNLEVIVAEGLRQPVNDGWVGDGMNEIRVDFLCDVLRNLRCPFLEDEVMQRVEIIIVSLPENGFSGVVKIRRVEINGTAIY